MTVPVPLDAFDHAHSVKPRLLPPRDTGKLVGLALTAVFHVAVVAALLTAVHVRRANVARELSVAVLPDKPAPREELAPPPKMDRPAPVTVAIPEFTVRQPVVSPVMAAPAQAQARPAAPPVVAQKSPVAGEGHDAFLGRLLGQLNRFKQYPRAARQARIEGVVMLHFIMDANGKVLTAQIAKSSGRPVLDAEALALIARAQPLPALPADFPSRTLDAIVPIEFYLDR